MARAAWLLVVLLACGPDERPEPSPDGGELLELQLSPAFAGIWTGTLVTRTSTKPETQRAATLRVALIADAELSVGGTCPGSPDVTLEMRGSIRDASWMGRLTCPPATEDGCVAAVRTHLIAYATLLSDGALRLSLTSGISGCGQTLPSDQTFVGQK
jgi:hypothetical protein